jgi:hypothetical protein
MQFISSSLILILCLSQCTPVLAAKGKADISNDDVGWTAGTFGMSWILSGKTSKAHKTITKKDAQQLLELLDDPKRFAAAHILLEHLYGSKGDVDGTWSGLVVEVTDDGFSYDPKQRKKLIEVWKSRLKLEGATDKQDDGQSLGRE